MKIARLRLAPLKLPPLVGLVLTLAACSALAGAPTQLTVHQQDFGRTIGIRQGDHVKVDLLDTFPVPGSSVVWTADSTDPAVLSRLSESRETPAGIANSHAHYIAIFKALKAGRARIEMTGAARCEAMNPAFCPQPTGQITINVS